MEHSQAMSPHETQDQLGLGIDAGVTWVPWAFVAASVVSVLVIWRRDVEWRSRELIGAGFLLLFAIPASPVAMLLPDWLPAEKLLSFILVLAV